MKKQVNMEAKTLVQIMNELEEVVDKHNQTEGAADRIKLKAQADKLKDDYNKTAKLNAYAECLEAANPILELVKRYSFEVVNIGADRETGNMTIKTESTNGVKLSEVFNLWDFVAFCEGKNKQVTAALDWKVKAAKAQNTLIDNIRKYISDGTEKDVSGLKDAIQAMFDAVLMIPGKSGNNAVIFTSKQARLVYMTAGRLNNKNLTAMFGQEKSWQKQAFAFLYASTEKKEFTCLYGDEAPATDDPEAEAEAPAEEAAAETK